MSQPDDADQYYRFLIDAESDDQYLVSLDPAKTPKLKNPLICDVGPNVAPGKSLRTLAVGEEILAFDDHPRFVTSTNKETGKQTLLGVKTTIYQITRPDQGPAKIKSVDVRYKATIIKEKDEYKLRYMMEDESYDRVTGAGFSRALHRQILAAVEYKESVPMPKDGKTPVNPHFPPHNKKGAYEARSIADSFSDTPAPENKEDKTMSAVSGDFKKAANPHDPKISENDCRIKDHDLDKALAKYCTDLSDLAKDGKLAPTVGGEELYPKLAKILLRQKKAGGCLTGDPGVGKSAFFAGFAQYLHDNKDTVAEPLRDARVLGFSIQDVLTLSDSHLRGQFEKELSTVIDGIKERKGWFKGRKIVLGIDEMYDQMQAGGGVAAELIKQYITTPGTGLLAAMTEDEYRTFIGKNKALERRLEQVKIDPPNVANTKKILEGVWSHMRKHHHLKEDLSDKQVDFLVGLTERFMPSLSQPDKSITVLDTAAASAVFKKASGITNQDILEAVAPAAKVPISFLTSDQTERILSLEKTLPEQILGQPGIAEIPKRLKRARAGLTDPRKPMAAFLFTGPSRSGKTETARVLAKELFGTEDALIRLNMADFMDEFAVSKFKGAPPGYVGYNDPPVLERIRQRPSCVLLLDEIEKGHPLFMDLLLGILDEGKAEDMQGRVTKFRDVVIVMTSNIGAREAHDPKSIKARPVGFTKGEEDKAATTKEIYNNAVRTYLRPEMLNRVNESGGVINFNQVDDPSLRIIIRREVAAIEARLGDPVTGTPNVSIRVSQSLEDDILTLCQENRAAGAGLISGAVGDRVGDPLADVLLRRKAELEEMVAKHGHVTITVGKAGEEVVFTPGRPPANDSAPVVTMPKILPGGPRAAA